MGIVKYVIKILCVAAYNVWVSRLVAALVAYEGVSSLHRLLIPLGFRSRLRLLLLRDPPTVALAGVFNSTIKNINYFEHFCMVPKCVSPIFYSCIDFFPYKLFYRSFRLCIRIN